MLADCGTPSSQLGFFCSAVRAVTVESFEVFLAVKHCQDRQAQLQSAQCNNMFEVGLPSQSARSYWSHKSCFEQPYWARKLGSNRCGQVIGQAATDQLSLWGNPTMPIVSHTAKLRRRSTRTTIMLCFTWLSSFQFQQRWVCHWLYLTHCGQPIIYEHARSGQTSPSPSRTLYKGYFCYFFFYKSVELCVDD